MYLECTEEHKWFIRKGNKRHPETCKVEKVFTKDLQIGDVVGIYSLPVIDVNDPDEFQNPYTHGFFCGDGTYVNGYPYVMLYGPKQALLAYLSVSTICPHKVDDKTACYLTGNINKAKFYVPIN
jgi:ribonucleoside-diphosphate reductase alpha chain